MFSASLELSLKSVKLFRKKFNYTRLKTDEDNCYSECFEENNEYIEDLIISKGRRKKRLWIAGSIIAVVVIAAIIAVVVVLTTADDDNTNGGDETTNISLEDILENKLSARSFNATWISDSKLLYRDSPGNLMTYNLENNEKKEIFPSNPLLINSIISELSPDGKFILFGFEYQKLYRHSFYAKYTVIDLDTKEETEITIPNQRSTDQLALQYCGWSTQGNALVFVYLNNIYYKSSVNDDAKQLTTDGRDGYLYNGIPDWVYEEEIVASNKALWFSDDGKKLAYAKYNDQNVPIMTIPFYGIPGSLPYQYTRAVQIRYPKPNRPNPIVSLHVIDLTKLESTTINLEKPGNLNDDAILSAVTWATSEDLCAIWMNRVQNKAYIVSYETSENTYKTIKYLEENKGWLDLYSPPTFSLDGSQLILILSQDQGNNAGGYRHIVKLNRQENSELEALTHGKFVVTEILKWKNNFIYYEANTEEDPGVKHVYSYQINTKTIKCLSCDLKNANNESCLYNSAKFSEAAGLYVLNCAGPGVPSITIHNSEGHKIFDWEENQSLLEKTNSLKLPQIKTFTFETEGGFKAQVMLKLPADADLSGDTKYPMLVKVYGGPDSYQVDHKYLHDWGTYLAVNKSIIYATIDGRGSGLKGDKMMFTMYKKMGTVEVEDQIKVTKLIQETLPYVDSSRTAIWGWSYGGYASGMALAMDKEDVFKCGMSVAPVTDWTLYDSIYTERFMGLPTDLDNSLGYENAKLLNKYEGLRDKLYFLIHGTFDDNVHYQQSMLWSKVLEHQDILFRQQSYPDEDHGLAAVRPHLYHSLEHFLDECFIDNVD
nr:venom dipeptidyl peptidase 4 isoform X1 [Onthophagus taurus]